MKRFMNKKAVAIGLAAGLALGAAGIAVATWSTTGSVSGNAKAYSNQTTTVTATVSPSAATNLYPGGTGAPLGFTVDNKNPYAISFSTWTSTDTITTSNETGCPGADWFSMAASGNVTGPAATSVPAGNSSTAGATNTNVTMDVNAPDACQASL
jgi:hypothetical protein